MVDKLFLIREAHFTADPKLIVFVGLDGFSNDRLLNFVLSSAMLARHANRPNADYLPVVRRSGLTLRVTQVICCLKRNYTSDS